VPLKLHSKTAARVSRTGGVLVYMNTPWGGSVAPRCLFSPLGPPGWRLQVLLVNNNLLDALPSLAGLHHLSVKVAAPSPSFPLVIHIAQAEQARAAPACRATLAVVSLCHTVLLRCITGGRGVVATDGL
jgi:hypothetical protein